MRQVFLCLLIVAGTAVHSQTYKEKPLIRSGSMQADYRVNHIWTKGQWRIAPEAIPDVLPIPTFSKTVQFAFYTDIDSIIFPMKAGQVEQFYVLTNDGQYALTEVRGFNYDPVSFDETVKAPAFPFFYEENRNNAYLQSFRNQYPLAKLVEGVHTDSAKALRVLKWVHDQWKHNGSNQPRKKDALSILAEVKEGKKFRCVEYGIVTTAALNALGMPARVLALKTRDVEITESGAGHVLLEVYLNDMKKWVVLDGQHDAMPVLHGIPLNAVEFQQAISGNYDALEIRSLSGTNKDTYIKWVFPYLYYFDVSFDNREFIDGKKALVEGKQVLMLVPAGAKNPTVFQKKWPIGNVAYTNSIADFYAPPFVK